MRERMWHRRAVVLVVVALAAAGCNSGSTGLRVDLDKSNEERLLQYYLGGVLGPDGGDAEAAGVLVRDGSSFAIQTEALDPSIRDALQDRNGDGVLDWEEFVAFVEATYGEARGLPPTLGALRAEAPYAEGDSAWFTVDVDGVMTAARRRIYVPRAALRAAIDGYNAAGDKLLYPVGTVLVGEHRIDGQVVETTVKRRRADGFWDFAVYDAEGHLAPSTTTEPRPLRAPVQCVGCHLGQRRFDPEQRFPAPSADGPYGPRAIYVDEALRSAPTTAEAAAFFNEHAKRSDGVLGLYATLYTAQLLADREAGRIAPEDAALLDALGL